MPLAFVNGKVLLPDGRFDRCCVVVEHGNISKIADKAPREAVCIDLEGQFLLPGFIDVQVNGGGGRLFNDEPTVETVTVIAEAHRRFGTTGLLPTVISDDFSVISRAIAAVDAAIEAYVPGVLGIHIEGPFLSHARRGIHLAEKLQMFDDEFLDLIHHAHRGVILLTVAPECISPAQIRSLVETGVIVAAGHSDADYETVRVALDAGMTGFTHLFNAMSQLTGRAPAMVGAALEDRSVYASVIVDGHHVHPATLRVAVNAKGAERLLLVTDAMPTVGAEDDEFILQGRAIRRDGDRLTSTEGVLAGSTLTMVGAVANAVEQGRIDLSDAVRMATVTPAQFVGLSGKVGAIEVGHRADLVAMTDDFTITRTWINGDG